jgi:hypothetical protein
MRGILVMSVEQYSWFVKNSEVCWGGGGGGRAVVEVGLMDFSVIMVVKLGIPCTETKVMGNIESNMLNN